MLDTDLIPKLKIQLADRDAEIKTLRNVLNDHDIYKCCVCSNYTSKPKHQKCDICEEHVCWTCVKWCGNCLCHFCPDPCYSSSQPNTNHRGKSHFKCCHICHMSNCKSFECDLCNCRVCDSCSYYCCVHRVSACLNCQGSCQNNNHKCRACHLKKCGLCWNPIEFKCLNFNNQSQILTLLCIFKYMTPTIISPPKFIKHIIIRHLIHPN